MLSKLFFYKNAATIPNTNESIFAALEKHYRKAGMTSVIPAQANGTLGVFYIATKDNKKVFVKTHLRGDEYRTNLRKEIMIMEHLYRDVLVLTSFELTIDGYVYCFLEMDLLEPLCDKPGTDEVKNLIGDFNTKLKSFDYRDTPFAAQFSTAYNIGSILEESKKALSFLISRNLVLSEIGSTVAAYFDGFEPPPLEDYMICHGDLSNKNILLKGDRLIIIDWEDAFLGCRGFDFAYWLTFFDQRKYYDKELLNNSMASSSSSLVFMLATVVIKCYISFLNHSYLTNSLTFNDRLTEIIDLI